MGPHTEPSRVEALEDSAVPAELIERGYVLTEDGEGERILTGAVVQHFTTGPGGEMVPLTEGSTRPITMTTRSAGIARTKRYTFTMP